MATKSLSFFAVLIILFLVIFEVPEIEAQPCLKQYVGGFTSDSCFGQAIQVCYWKCRLKNKAKGGICYSGKGADNYKCLCDFCSDNPSCVGLLKFCNISRWSLTFGYQNDGLTFGSGVWSFISDDMLNSSSIFDSFPTWCDSPSSTDTLVAQYGLPTSSPTPFGVTITSSHAAAPRYSTWSSSYYGQEMSFRIPHHSLDINELSGKRRSVLNCTIPRSLSHSLDEKMLKALSLFVQLSGSGEGVLAQVWTPIKTGEQYMLSTCDQAYLLDPRLSQYREVSRKLTFASKPNQCSYPGLPGRVFISGLREWTSNVMYYKKDEYLRDKHAIDNDSSNGSGAVMLRSSSPSMDDRNQMRTHKGNSSESGFRTFIVKATYREDTIRFKFDPSVGCLQLYKEVGKRFRLQDGLFQLKYFDDEEEWVMLVTDSDLQERLEILVGMGKHTVKFLVRDVPGPIGSSAGSSGYLGEGL
ncbi:hypothetical protein F2Q68_00028342 [Brassica cretica]|uniref:PB1 domain-containing protein n=1 Tax=Brassica cretica TaxID=69181 RepID=A0A8S9IGR0_BRACR|nr:hypothetical protein F2Q68_00028342 [Brassica cretica]